MIIKNLFKSILSIILFFIIINVAYASSINYLKNISDANLEFKGSVNGVWVDPVPSGDKPYFDGVGENLFYHGTASNENTSSDSVQFIGNNFIVPSEKPFDIGIIAYHNGTISKGTNATSVKLRLNIELQDPKVIQCNFSFQLNFNPVEETDDPWESADYVNFPNTFPKELITIDGIEYTLEIIGFSKDNGTTYVNQFRVLENYTMSAKLYGWITKVPSTDLANLNIKGPINVLIGNCGKYSCEAIYENDPKRDVTEAAMWSTNCENSIVDSKGLFISSENTIPGECNITSFYQNKSTSIKVNLINKDSIVCTDTDKDGVIDIWDKCTNTSENVFVDRNGCPIDIEEGFYTEDDMKKMIRAILTWGDFDNDDKIGLSDAINILLFNSGVLKCSNLSLEYCHSKETCENTGGYWCYNPSLNFINKCTSSEAECDGFK